ncbi:MAG: flippase-like domain-containing protein [Rhodanobacter sp.]|nr:MAG: flippase-like domain-containing protein [Rhodanobacter sp.]TAL99611.1 MAG: flippase-like domain-containing protein [Rhodanobacter sp.]TAM41018.1 MAG: flippase-like domain-containing protein [Rhodanobacter sp.]
MPDLAQYNPKAPVRRWYLGYSLRVLGALVAVVAGYWLLRSLDFERLVGVLGEARPGYLLLVPTTVLAEQWVRAWKWRQIVSAICELRTTWAFRALMAGYVPGLAVGFGTSALARSWLLARRTGTHTSTLLATTTVDRLIDAFAFAFFIGLTAVVAELPSSQVLLTQGLRWSGLLVVSIALFVLLLLTDLRRGRGRRFAGVVRILPTRTRTWLKAGVEGYAHGIVWPRAQLRRAGIVAAALLIKLIAGTQYLWAGLAFGIVLAPGDYLFIMVFLGTLVFLGFFVRVPGTGLLASLFALELLGVPKAEALAMTLTVIASFILTIVVGGGVALIREGVGLSQLLSRARNVGGGHSSG